MTTDETAILVTLLLLNIGLLSTGVSGGSTSCDPSRPLCYTIQHTTQVSWLQAEHGCSQSGGTLAQVGEGLLSFVAEQKLDLTSFWIRNKNLEGEDEFRWRWIDRKGVDHTIPLELEDALSLPADDSSKCGLINVDENKEHNLLTEPCGEGHGIICVRDYPADCLLTHLGGEYRGDKGTPTDGGECEEWTLHSQQEAWTFPDESVGAAGNHCRNPDLSPGGPWCFSTTNSTRTSCSNIPKCAPQNFPGCSTDELIADDIVCHDNQCYIMLNGRNHGNKSWTTGMECCSRFGGHLMTSSGDDVIDTYSQRAGKGKATDFWIGLTNTAWKWMFVNSSSPSAGTACPVLHNRANVYWNLDSCDLLKPHICQKENSGYIRSTTSSSPETVSNTHIEGDATTQALPTTTTGTVPEKSKQNHTGLGVGLGLGLVLLCVIVSLLILLLLRQVKRTRSDEDQLINSPTRTQQVHFSNHGDESDVTIDTSHGRHGDVPVQTHNLGDHDNAVQR